MKNKELYFIGCAVVFLSSCKVSVKKQDTIKPVENEKVELTSQGPEFVEKVKKNELNYIEEALKLTNSASPLLNSVSSDDQELGRSRIGEAIELLEEITEEDSTYIKAQNLISEYNQILNSEGTSKPAIQAPAINVPTSPESLVSPNNDSAEQEVSPAPAPEVSQLPVHCNTANQTGPPFPDWLFGQQKSSCQTDFYLYENPPSDEYSIFGYSNRFAVRFRDWPFTLLNDNKAEWTYVDCKTGWTAQDESRLSGASSPLKTFEPSKISNIDIMKSNCSKVGIQPEF